MHLSKLPKRGGLGVSWVWGKAHLPAWEMAGSQQTALISVSGAELKTTCSGLWLVTHLQLRWNLRSLCKDKSLDVVDVEQHLPDICWQLNTVPDISTGYNSRAVLGDVPSTLFAQMLYTGGSWKMEKSGFCSLLLRANQLIVILKYNKTETLKIIPTSGKHGANFVAYTSNFPRR